MVTKDDKEKIARIFREMADLLAIKGENPFRIRAYEKASDILSIYQVISKNSVVRKR